MGTSETLEQVNREGRERLYPSLTNPSWLVLRERRKLFNRWLAMIPGRQLRVLDVGGRIQPYRPLLEDRLECYIAVDVRSTPLVTLVARGEQLPLRDCQFDLVICTQVLEYIPEPRQVIAEIYRVLKPGGTLLVSVPAMFPRDSEEDSSRFMPKSLRMLLSPFREVEVLPEGSSIHGLFRTIAIWFALFAKPAILAKLLELTLIPLLNMAAMSLASIIPTTNDQFAANFSACAQK
jgi:SAM-dependent methyltransferase